MSTFKFDEAVSRASEGANGPAAVLAARNSAIRSAFRDTVERLGWKLLTRERRPIAPRTSRTFVLGVVLWSKVDLTALDDLAALDWIREKGIPVEVFDIDDCLSLADVQVYLPDVTPIVRTPVLAEYIDTRLVQCWVGAEVSQWCHEASQGDPRDVDQKEATRVAEAVEKAAAQGAGRSRSKRSAG